MRDTGKRIRYLWKKFASRKYREGFLKSRLHSSVASQIYFIRESRGWTQSELAEKAGTKQPAISRMEKGQGALSVRSLEAIANAFDVGLEIRFVPFSHLARDAAYGRIEEYVQPFTDDLPDWLVDVPNAGTLPANRISYRDESHNGLSRPSGSGYEPAGVTTKELVMNG